ncbi:hypothetical protein GBK2_44 [Geobacillus phage GBK2]|uniref:hypothetical protein n=1 Tax=Geobacillus phage GBK2 TaxID=1458842 RepID=UPI0003F21746|nr:hypothetical protein GBK2_44 [Geobacillus phage GBK2]AHJ88642.1 hypothetical protein GBK2_44 [Geobacillus phage GBK2]
MGEAYKFYSSLETYNLDGLKSICIAAKQYKTGVYNFEICIQGEESCGYIKLNEREFIKLLAKMECIVESIENCRRFERRSVEG